MEAYEKPSMEVIALSEEDVILTSGGCVIVSSTIEWDDGAGNHYIVNGN